MRRKISPLLIIISYLIAFTQSLVFAQPGASAEQMLSELGCAYCHSGLPAGAQKLNEKIPDLSGAGLRYNPAYLFDYLQRPAKIRRHIGLSRMPDFKLSEGEALALTLFLEGKTATSANWPVFPPDLDQTSGTDSGIVSPGEFITLIHDSLICLSCHTYQEQGGSLAVDLASTGYRLQPAWVKKYLAAPSIFGVPAAVMPPQFYELSPDGENFTEIRSQAAETINRLTDYLFTSDKKKREQLEAAFNKAKTSYPAIDAEMGKQIFIALNCAACHRHQTIKPSREAFAPDLSGEGLRVTEAWLKDFLKNPHAIRPFGYHPGSGSRMPDFRLSPQEVDEIASYLLRQKKTPPGFVPNFKPEELSRFSMRKAKLLLQDKLSCLGCHQLDGEGGKVGPDLSGLGRRLQPAYVYNMINNPAKMTPAGVMPKVAMTPETMKLIVNYLLQQTGAKADSSYLSLINNPVLSRVAGNPAQENYLRLCAACHGPGGGGDGFNARFLPVKPTAHSDRIYMAKRPDDTLFDGTFAGGYILNRSQRMPPWGETLSFKEIKALVTYMRQLCNCQGPEWSRDDR